MQARVTEPFGTQGPAERPSACDPGSRPHRAAASLRPSIPAAIWAASSSQQKCRPPGRDATRVGLRRRKIKN